MAKAIKEAEDTSSATYLVVGSHGLCTSGLVLSWSKTFAPRANAFPTRHVAAEIKDMWPEVPLFVDACYSTMGRGNVDYEGHDSDLQGTTMPTSKKSPSGPNSRCSNGAQAFSMYRRR